MTNVTLFPDRRPKPPTVDGMTEHLFEYQKATDDSLGTLWGISVWAIDEQDARDRLRRAAEGNFVGVVYQRVPVDEGAI